MLQGLNWRRLMPALDRGAQLRAGLALLAVHKAAGDGAYAEWLWRLLEGPVGAALTCCVSSAGRRTSDPPPDVRHFFGSLPTTTVAPVL